MTPAQFKHDRAAEAVADHDGPLQSQLGTLPGDIVGEPRHGVFLLRRVAGAVAAKIDGPHAAGLPEMGDLGREDTMVAGPAIDKNQRRALRNLGWRLKMREAHTAAIQKSRLQRFVRDHGLSPGLTLYSCSGVKRWAGPTTPTYDAIASRQKESITTAIDNAERPSNSAATSALDDAAAIICTNAIMALVEPAMSGIGRNAPFMAFGEINPNDNATPIITDTTTAIDLPPAMDITSKDVAMTVESARPIAIISPRDMPQRSRRLLTKGPSMTHSE